MSIKYAHATFAGEASRPNTHDAIMSKSPRQGQRYFIIIQQLPKAVAISVSAVTRKDDATLQEAAEEIKEGKRARMLPWIQYANETEFKRFWSTIEYVPIEQVRVMLDDPNLV